MDSNWMGKSSWMEMKTDSKPTRKWRYSQICGEKGGMYGQDLFLFSNLPDYKNSLVYPMDIAQFSRSLVIWLKPKTYFQR